MLKITSPVFFSGELISQKYTCRGDNVNPPLIINNVPDKTQSLALIVDDPDAPRGTWTHWIAWNIDPMIKEIKENSVPTGAIVGVNDSGETRYDGPCPPSGTHRYFFKIYALDTVLNLPYGSGKVGLEKAMKDHIIDMGELMGKYSRSERF